MSGCVLRRLLLGGVALLSLLVLHHHAAGLALPAAASLTAADVVAGQLTELAFALLRHTPAAAALLPAVVHSAPPVAQELVQHGRVLRVAGGGVGRRGEGGRRGLQQHGVGQVIVDGEGVGRGRGGVESGVERGRGRGGGGGERVGQVLDGEVLQLGEEGGLLLEGHVLQQLHGDGE